MIRGIVTGNVWSTKRVDGLPGGALLDVTVDGSGATIVAFDVMGTGTGEHVIVAQGSVAAAWFPGTPPPVDALIIGSIDDPAEEAAGSRPKSAARRTRST